MELLFSLSLSRLHFYKYNYTHDGVSTHLAYALLFALSNNKMFYFLHHVIGVYYQLLPISLIPVAVAYPYCVSASVYIFPHERHNFAHYQCIIQRTAIHTL